MDLEAIADRLFAAAEKLDWETFGAMLSPDCRLRQNGEALSLDALIQNTEAISTGVRYSDVRRVVSSDAIAEQHAITLTTRDGKEILLPDVCVVVRFSPEGQVDAMEEYIPPLPRERGA